MRWAEQVLLTPLRRSEAYRSLVTFLFLKNEKLIKSLLYHFQHCFLSARTCRAICDFSIFAYTQEMAEENSIVIEFQEMSFEKETNNSNPEL